MEQLTNPIFKLDAFALNADGERVPFALSIFDGEGDAYHHDCWLRCRHIRDRDMKIVGVDQEQAIALAIRLIDDLLRHKGDTLVDADGKVITLPPYEYTVTEP